MYMCVLVLTSNILGVIPLLSILEILCLKIDSKLSGCGCIFLGMVGWSLSNPHLQNDVILQMMDRLTSNHREKVKQWPNMGGPGQVWISRDHGCNGSYGFMVWFCFWGLLGWTWDVRLKEGMLGHLAIWVELAESPLIAFIFMLNLERGSVTFS